MAAELITGPAALALSLAAAKQNLRIDADLTDVDDLVTAWIEGVVGHAEHLMGRAIISQEWRLTLAGFTPCIRLPMPPVMQIVSVEYYDADGVQRTLPESAYELNADPVAPVLLPAAGTAWPATMRRYNAVTVNVICGYGEDDQDTPASIKLYLAAKLREQFDPSVRPEKDTVQASFIDRLLDRYVIQVV